MSSEQQAGNGHQGHDHGPKGDNQSVSGHEAAGHEAAGHEAAGHEAAGHEAAGHEAAGHEAAGHEAAGHEAAGQAAGEEPNPHPEATGGPDSHHGHDHHGHDHTTDNSDQVLPAAQEPGAQPAHDHHEQDEATLPAHDAHDDHAGHEHHGHAHDHAAELRESTRRTLIIALVLIGGFMVAEVFGGIYSGSLALLADAGHMLTDAASIALALVAVWIAGRPESIERTFGYQRTEVLAATFNALSLWVIAGWIVWEAIERLVNHHTIEIEGGLMLIIGGLGLAVNIVAAFVLHAGSKHSLNVDGAFRHVLADLMGSVGVVISGLVVILTDWVLIDPILSLGIAVLIVVSSWKLVLRSVNVLLGGVPEHIDLYALCSDVEEVEGVTLIHDVHVFTVTSNFEFLTAHVLMDPSFQGDTNDSLETMRNIISDKYGIGHVTLQLCRTANTCSENHHVGHLEAVARPPR